MGGQVITHHCYIVTQKSAKHRNAGSFMEARSGMHYWPAGQEKTNDQNLLFTLMTLTVNLFRL